MLLLQKFGMTTGANTMNLLSKDWQPSQAIMDKHKEVNHDRETKYFKHFYHQNQYQRSDWDQEYSKWCDQQTQRKRNRGTTLRKTQRVHETDSFYHRVFTELSDK